MKERKNNWIICDHQQIPSNINFKEDPSLSIYDCLDWSLHLENLGWKCFRWKNVINKNESGFVVSFIKFYPLKQQ